MLVLTRKSDESVIIGGNIEVRVIDVHGDQVRLGFSAPRDVAIHRKEVYDAIQQENIRAAAQGGRDMKTIESALKQTFSNGVENDQYGRQDKCIKEPNRKGDANGIIDDEGDGGEISVRTPPGKQNTECTHGGV